MPSSLPQVADALQHVPTEVPAGAARGSGFCQRRSKLTAALFVQTVVLGWLQAPRGSRSDLARTAADLGLAISPQGLAQRFTPAAAALLEAVLTAAVLTTVTAEAVAVDLLKRFNGVYVLDGTTIALPDGLAPTWPGCGGRVAANTQAALKLSVMLDLLGGRLLGPICGAGRTQDKAGPLQQAPLPAGALRITDLGFWSLDVLRAIAEQGASFLSRLHLQTSVWVGGTRVDLPGWLAGQGAHVDAAVELGAAARLPARLLAAPVPRPVAAARRRKLRAAARREGKTPPAANLALAGWTLLVANAPAARLGVAEALVLARARWQIELLFKRWKSHGAVDEWRSAQPDRIRCEVYAKLVAMVVQHRIILTGCWAVVDRSLVEAAKAVRDHAAGLAVALGRRPHLLAVLAALQRRLATACRLDKRRAHPNTVQLLLDPALGGLARCVWGTACRAPTSCAAAPPSPARGAAPGGRGRW